MTAVVYVGLTIAFGDAIARRFFTYGSRPRRLATAFLVGLALSTWLTYLDEDLYVQHFEAVFRDPAHGNLVIHKVPAAAR